MAGERSDIFERGVTTPPVFSGTARFCCSVVVSYCSAIVTGIDCIDFSGEKSEIGIISS